jgi:3alpha(or 20beta)-hydroxysteroid dehydrogenase
MGALDGSVALVSGGARGQGESHVRGLLAEGAKVVFGDILVAEGRALAEELGPDAAFAPLDVTDEAAWAGAVARTEELFGPPDVLVNNAGIPSWTTVADTTAEDFRRVVDVNLTGEFLGMKAVIPAMTAAGRGVIVNLSSAVGMVGYQSCAPYVASKWGVRGLTKAAALELGRSGVRVVSVHPGPIRTPMIEAFSDEQASGSQPMNRVAEAEEVTRMIVFLITGATFSTGSEFVIDGGMTLGHIEAGAMQGGK